MPRLLASLALTLTFALPAFAGASNSLLDVTPDGKLIVVANTDADTVSVVDAKARKLLREVRVGDHPEGVAWVGDGPLALVTLWGDDRLVFLDASEGKVLHALAVDDEPYGVVVTRDGKRAYVTHDYPGTVSEIDVESRKVLRTFQAGACARGIALANDERTLYVTEFFTARLVAISIGTGNVVDSWTGGETENLCRQVAVHPKWPKAYLPHVRSRVGTVDARGSIFGHLAVCDLTPPKEPDEPRRRGHAVDAFNGVQVASNPWEVAVTPDGSRVYVIYSGTNDLNYFDAIDDSYKDVKTRGFPRVGSHPRAIRVSPNGQELYVSNTLDHEVAVYDLDVKKLAAVKVCEPPRTAQWRRGKELFVSAKQPMGAVKWISCSSCHPDGLTDGRVWQNPEGDRRTPNLFGLAHTHPLHWSADRDEVQDFEYTIRGNLMRGRGLFSGDLKQGALETLPGLSMDLTGQSEDLDALALYTNSFHARMSPHAPGGKLTPEAERGKKLFFSTETKCATCHGGPYYTDSSLKAKPFNRHDVGTGDSPREKMGAKYDTPTLIGVYRTGPYLHDGRAKTLRDVLTTRNAGDGHGKTSHLKPNEIDELVAFLKSLPYEQLPDDTPNTVKHFLRRADPAPKKTER
jgi:YVTN family beta-propeller protein